MSDPAFMLATDACGRPEQTFNGRARERDRLAFELRNRLPEFVEHVRAELAGRAPIPGQTTLTGDEHLGVCPHCGGDKVRVGEPAEKAAGRLCCDECLAVWRGVRS